MPNGKNHPHPPAPPVPTSTASSTELKKRGRKVDASKRQAVIEVATQFFIERGYTSTSLLEVAKIAKVSRVTIYSYFANKKALFEACLAYSAYVYIPQLDPQRMPCTNPRVGLHTIASEYLQVFRNPNLLCAYRLMLGLQQEISREVGVVCPIQAACSSVPYLVNQSASSTARELYDIIRLFHYSMIEHTKRPLLSFFSHAHQLQLLYVPDPDYAAELFISLFQDTTYHGILLGVGNMPTPEQDATLIDKHVETLLRVFSIDAKPSLR